MKMKKKKRNKEDYKEGGRSRSGTHQCLQMATKITNAKVSETSPPTLFLSLSAKSLQNQ